MKKIYSRIAALALMLASVNAIAQNLESGFFTDGYLYRHEMNPAIENDRNYVSMLMLGNVNIGMSGNIGVKNLLYNRGGQTVLFTNKLVSPDEFLGGIKNRNKINANIRLQLMGAGFKAWGGYNTIGIGLRSNTNIVIPKPLLEMAKNGLTNQTYDVGGLGIHEDSYIELALGHSRKINDKWRVGAKVKFLVGLGCVDANVSNAVFNLAEDGYVANVDAELNTNIGGLKYKTKASEHNKDANGNPRQVFNGVEMDGYKPNGFGVAFDLGAEYKISKDWRVLVSITDLGFISWKDTKLAATHGEINTNNHTFNVDDDAPNNFDDEMDRLGDDLATLYELEDKGNVGKRAKMLGATMNIGGEYVFPYYRKLTFGLLNTTRIQGKYSWTNFRLSANVAPVKVFSAGINLGVGTFGTSFGWILNFHTKGFSLFAGMDHTMGKLAKQGIPLSSNTEFNIGMNFPF